MIVIKSQHNSRQTDRQTDRRGRTDRRKASKALPCPIYAFPIKINCPHPTRLKNSGMFTQSGTTTTKPRRIA